MALDRAMARGGGGAIWARVSTPVFNALRSHNHSSFHMTSIMNDAIQLVVNSFVADTHIVQSPPTGNFLKDPTQRQDVLVSKAVRIQGSLDSWCRGLTESGGVMEPIKSFCYLIYFLREQGFWKYFTIMDSPESVTVKDDNGVPV